MRCLEDLPSGMWSYPVATVEKSEVYVDGMTQKILTQHQNAVNDIELFLLPHSQDQNDAFVNRFPIIIKI